VTAAPDAAPDEARAAGERRDRLIALLASRYGAAHPELRPVYEHPDAAIYRVDRRSGAPWVARLFPPRRARERVRGDATVLRWVAGGGIPAERVVATSAGEDVVALGEWSVLVTAFVAGEPADRSPATLRRLGDVLGRLHALPAPRGGGDVAAAVARAGGATPANDLPFGRACLERVAGRVPAALAGRHAALGAVLAATGDGSGLPHALSHNDCHLGNALRTAAGEVALIDWSGSGQWPRVAALGVLLFSCAVQAPGEAPSTPLGGDPAAVAHVLEGYRRRVALTAAEVAYLPQAVRFRPAVIAARELAAAVEAGRTPDASTWGARYGEAEAVAARAAEVLAPARRRAGG
jgi:Ser/Thr protein kinase RdoA (MazF antagonist)